MRGTCARAICKDLPDSRQAIRQPALPAIAYLARASNDGADDYEAHCTSTYRRLGHEEWRVVQHQQTPPLTASA